MKVLYKILLVHLLFANLFAYPKTFSQLGTPLYESSKNISKLLHVGDTQQYMVDANLTISSGFIADKSNNAKDKKSYLLQLRKLQKKYDKFIYTIDKQINLSIQKDDYSKFVRLVDSDIDGLLKSRSLLKKSLIYYKKNRMKKKSNFLDAKIEEANIITATNMEFDTKVTKESFSSKDKIDKRKKVYMYSKEKENQITLFFRNNNPYTITVSVKGYTKNLDYSNVKKTISIKKDTTFEYAKLYKKENLFDSYQFSFKWVKGTLDAKHDEDYIYRLPYEIAKEVAVSQGFNGATSHKGSNSYAVDFAMDIGSKIYAARGGMVVDIKEDSDLGGYDKKYRKDGNLVTIEHSDGTMATYYHLKKDGVKSKLRDKVRKGEHIAYSGNTGYTSGPHLHFQIFKAISGSSIQTVPMKFLSENGVVTEPKAGVYYKAK